MGNNLEKTTPTEKRRILECNTKMILMGLGSEAGKWKELLCTSIMKDGRLSYQ
jgi:hypothetical protein